MFGNFGQSLEPNYDNHVVQNIKEQLRPYDYTEFKPSNDGVKREMRELFTMENGARYEGEWTEAKRDGMGQ
jgi:hypothetical protein